MQNKWRRLWTLLCGQGSDPRSWEGVQKGKGGGGESYTQRHHRSNSAPNKTVRPAVSRTKSEGSLVLDGWIIRKNTLLALQKSKRLNLGCTSRNRKDGRFRGRHKADIFQPRPSSWCNTLHHLRRVEQVPAEKQKRSPVKRASKRRLRSTANLSFLRLMLIQAPDKAVKLITVAGTMAAYWSKSVEKVNRILP